MCKLPRRNVNKKGDTTLRSTKRTLHCRVHLRPLAAISICSRSPISTDSIHLTAKLCRVIELSMSSPTCILSGPALAFAPSVQHTAEHTQWPAEYQRKRMSSVCGISLHLHLLESMSDNEPLIYIYISKNQAVLNHNFCREGCCTLSVKYK